VRVGGRRRGLVKTGVHAAAEVFDKCPEQPVVDSGDGEGRVDDQVGSVQGRKKLRSGSADQFSRVIVQD
jgi:hypothetical protein